MNVAKTHMPNYTIWTIFNCVQIHVFGHFNWIVLYCFNSVLHLCPSMRYICIDVFLDTVYNWFRNDAKCYCPAQFNVVLLLSFDFIRPSKHQWSIKSVQLPLTHYHYLDAPIPQLLPLPLLNCYRFHISYPSYIGHRHCFPSYTQPDGVANDTWHMYVMYVSYFG